MTLKRPSQVHWQHSHPILRALAVAHRDPGIAKVHILDPQPYTFHEAQSAAIEQPGHQSGRAVQMAKHSMHLIAGKYYRQTLRLGRPLDRFQPTDVLPEHFFIQKEERA